MLGLIYFLKRLLLTEFLVKFATLKKSNE